MPRQNSFKKILKTKMCLQKTKCVFKKKRTKGDCGENAKHFRKSNKTKDNSFPKIHECIIYHQLQQIQKTKDNFFLKMLFKTKASKK